MTEKRIHHVLDELNLANWQQLLDVTADHARHQADGKATITDCYVTLKFKFVTSYYEDYSDPDEPEHFSYTKFEPTTLKIHADKVHEELLSQLSDIEKCLMLEYLTIVPTIEYTDEQGDILTYEGTQSEYRENAKPTWLYLSFFEDASENRKGFFYQKTRLGRNGFGEIFLGQQLWPFLEHSNPNDAVEDVFVTALDDSGVELSQRNGTKVRLDAKKQAFQPIFRHETPECHYAIYLEYRAGLFFDKEQCDRSWTRFDCDYMFNGRQFSYHRERKQLKAGSVIIEKDHPFPPKVVITAMDDDSVTVKVRNEEFRIDRLNDTQVIARKGDDEYIKAHLHVPDPEWRKSELQPQSDPMPADVRIEVTVNGQTDVVHITEINTYFEFVKEERYELFFSGFAYGGIVIGSAASRLDYKDRFFRGILLPSKRMQIEAYDKHGKPVTMELHYLAPRIEYEDMLIEDNCLQLARDRKELIVPQGITTIDDGALIGMPSLECIHLPRSVKNLGKSFHNFQHRNLKVVYDGTLSEWWDVSMWTSGGYNIKSLIIDGLDWFEGDITLPDNITEVPNSAFSNCKRLTSVTLPKSIVNVGDSAFSYCDNLKRVTILGPADIGTDAFVSCDELKDVYLADGVKSIGRDCFSYCEKLKPIFIPKSVEKVDYQISAQNDGSVTRPVFACEATKKPDGWDEEWALTYYDPRFGLGHGYDYHHPVKWGCQRPPMNK